jgi:hypothetical protein
MKNTRSGRSRPCAARDPAAQATTMDPKIDTPQGANRPSRTRPIDRARQRDRLPTCEDVRPCLSSFAPIDERRRRCRHRCSQGGQRSLSGSAGRHSTRAGDTRQRRIVYRARNGRGPFVSPDSRGHPPRITADLLA